jgi:putative salt-induced outer membrane protein YdiY
MLRLFETKVSSLMKLLIIFCTASLIYADQIVMKNGDRVTGTIVRKDGDNLTIKTDQFGTVTTSWAKIDSIKSDKAETVVVQGKTLNGTIDTANGQIAITPQQGPAVTAPPADISAIRDADEQKAYERLQNPTWFQLWAGNASFGLAGSAGNAITETLTAAVTAARTTNTDKTSFYFNDIKSSAFANGADSETAQAVRGGWAYNHNVNPRLFFGVNNDFEEDRFQALNLRWVVGATGGYHAIKGKRAVLDLLAGGDFNHAAFSTNTERIAEYTFGNTFAFKLNSNTSITQDLHFFDDFTNANNFRGVFDLNATTKISRWITWNLSLSDHYLHIPVVGLKTNDVIYSTGLGIVFAH